MHIKIKHPERKALLCRFSPRRFLWKHTSALGERCPFPMVTSYCTGSTEVVATVTFVCHCIPTVISLRVHVCCTILNDRWLGTGYPLCFWKLQVEKTNQLHPKGSLKRHRTNLLWKYILSKWIVCLIFSIKNICKGQFFYELLKKWFIYILLVFDKQTAT